MGWVKVHLVAHTLKVYNNSSRPWLCYKFSGKMGKLTFVAQWTRLLTTNQKIAGSSPAKVIDMAEAFF